jgi:transcription elongation GreA/GreB family factor
LKQASRLESDQSLVDVVTLNNWVTVRDEENITHRRLLVVPQHVWDLNCHLSVLSPLGAALVGIRSGSSVTYVDLEGVSRVMTVEAVGSDNSFIKKSLAVALCTVALLLCWLALAFHSLP